MLIYAYFMLIFVNITDRLTNISKVRNLTKREENFDFRVSTFGGLDPNSIEETKLKS